MVYNPTFEGSIRFDQPVAPGPTGAEVLASIVGGLGVFETIADARQGPDAPDNLTESWLRYSQETGAPRNIADATQADLRGFAGFDPARADDAVNLNEQLGNQGFTQQRERRDANTEFLLSDYGRVVEANAFTLYPDDERARAAYIAEAQLDQAAELEGYARLSRQAEATTDRRQISDEAWDIAQAGIREASSAIAFGLAELAPAILSGGARVDQLPPEVQALIPPAISTITRENLGMIAGLYRQRLINNYRRNLTTAVGGQIMDPDDEYINSAFAMFNDTVTQIENATDSTALMTRLTNQDQLLLRQQLSQEDLAWITLLNTLPNSPEIQNWIRGTASEELAQVARNLADAARNGFAAPLDDESVGTARVTYEGAMTAITSYNSSRSNEGAQSLPGMVSAVVAGAERMGVSRIDDAVYDELLNPRLIAALGQQPGGQEALGSLAQLFLHDFGTDISNIQQQIEGTGSLVYQNGRFSIEMSDIIGDDGASLGTGRAPSTANRLVMQLNDRLEQLGPAGLTDLMGPEFEAILSAAQAEGPATRGGVLGVPTAENSVTAQEQQAALIARAAPGGSNREQQGTTTAGARTGTTVAGNFNDAVIASLAGTESSGRFDASNNVAGSGGRGHFGRLQFSRARFAEAQAAIPSLRGMTIEQFLQNPEAQMAAERWHIQDYRNRFRTDGLMQYVGTTIGGVTVTESGMLAAAHLGGYQGLRDFLESGGADNPSDAYGTDLLNYMMRHGGIDSSTGAPVELQPSTRGTQVMPGVYINPGIALNGRADASFTMQNASSMTNPNAEVRMSEVLQGPFQMMQQMFGEYVVINDAIAQAGTSRESQTPGSRHFHGDALDIDISYMSNEQRLRLVRAAHAAGFRGFGFGDGILHIDMGAPRSWDYGISAFAGMPLSDIQAMVATGAFSAEFPMLNEAGQPLEPTQANIESFMANAGVDYDPGEGEPRNLQVYDAPQVQEQEVEQGGDSSNATVTPEQGAQTAAAAAARQQGAPVDAEVQDLITALTDGASEEELQYIREALRALQGETRR